MKMDKFLDLSFLLGQLEFLKVWVLEEVLTVSSLAQLVVIAIFYGVARWSEPKSREFLDKYTQWRGTNYWIYKMGRVISPLTLTLIWLLLSWVSGLAAAGIKWPHHIITIAISLLTAWIVIRLASSIVRNEEWSKVVAIVAWAIAALNIVNLLDPIVEILDSASFKLGDFDFSALTFIKGIIALFAFLWLASIASDIIERQVNRSRNLTPSVRVLIAKVLKILFITLAIVIALDSVGIDLTAFTVFTGALGLGIGFGLQKSVSNLISGVMILMDKSVKPGDVIEVGDSYGWINRLGARYASVVTRDGIEHLIPNEELITQRVANWSHSNNQIRLKIPIGVAYGSDYRKAIELCLKVAAETERVIDFPESKCLIKALGDSSINLELRIWINDPTNGVSNIKSEILIGVLDIFNEHGIEIPYPQMELSIRKKKVLAD